MWRRTRTHDHRLCVNPSTFRHCHMGKGVTSPHCGSSAISHCIISQITWKGVRVTRKPLCPHFALYFKVFLPRSLLIITRRIVEKHWWKEMHFTCALCFYVFVKVQRKAIKLQFFFFFFSLNSERYLFPENKNASLLGQAEQNDDHGSLTDRYEFIHMNVTHTHQLCMNSICQF